MSKIKYVSSSGLTHYDEKIKKVIDEVDTSTNTKVTQTPTSTDASYPLLLSPSGQTQETNTTSYFNSGVVLNPSTKTISANIDGNSKTATKATSADKLNTNAGSASQPTYFADGIPKACTYSLNKTVPADAVFTDTIAVKSVEDTSIQLTDAKDANMLLNHAPINMLNITCTSQTVNGLTITVNPDKTIYVKGTATKTMYVTVGNFNVTNGQTFSFGQTKRVNGGVGDDGTSWDSYMWFKNHDGTGTWRGDGVYVATVTGTITVELYVKNGTTVDCTYYPRVYYENKSHYYVPPEGYTITACGKNLVDVSEISTWDSLNNSEYCQKMLKVKPNTKYTISQLSNRGNYSWLFIMSGRHTDYSANWMSVTTNGCLVDKPYTVTSDSEGFITVGSLNTITTDIQIQLEEGDTATDYEPFIGKKVTIDRNTTFPLSGLESYDGLTNVLNPYSATMEVTYATNEAGQGILKELETIEDTLAYKIAKLSNVETYDIADFFEKSADITGFELSGTLQILGEKIVKIDLHFKNYSSSRAEGQFTIGTLKKGLPLNEIERISAWTYNSKNSGIFLHNTGKMTLCLGEEMTMQEVIDFTGTYII